MGYMIGQRVVIYGKVIGTVAKPERNDMPNTEDRLWVFNPENNYASQYDAHNIKPLPNGQL